MTLKRRRAPIDGYGDFKVLGSGTSGTVFLAVHKESQKVVVMKKVPMVGFSEKDAVCAALEVQALQELEHPHIVHLYESFVDDNMLCIVMECAEGGDLDHLLKTKRGEGETFSEDQICRWVVELSSALEYCHERSYLHRDVKAPNVFLRAPDNSGHRSLLLGDFGLSALVDPEHAMRQTRVGTPYYMSPEVARGLPYTEKNDMWCLGVLLHRLCELQYPFRANNLQDLLRAIVEDQPVRIPGEYSDNLAHLVCDLLSKEKDKRPSASDVLALPFLAPYVKALDLNASPIPHPSFSPLSARYTSETISELKERALYERTQRDATD